MYMYTQPNISCCLKGLAKALKRRTNIVKYPPTQRDMPKHTKIPMQDLLRFVTSWPKTSQATFNSFPTFRLLTYFYFFLRPLEMDEQRLLSQEYFLDNCRSSVCWGPSPPPPPPHCYLKKSNSSPKRTMQRV